MAITINMVAMIVVSRRVKTMVMVRIAATATHTATSQFPLGVLDA